MKCLKTMRVLDELSFVIQQFDIITTVLSMSSHHEEPWRGVCEFFVGGFLICLVLFDVLGFFPHKINFCIYSFDTNPNSWYGQEYLGDTKITFKNYFILCFHAHNPYLTWKA